MSAGGGRPPSDYDLVVIGAGSGGVRAARVAAQLGARVAVVEDRRVGGTCVIRGCVPKKLLAYGSHFAEDLRDARRFGWHVPDCEFDWPRLRDAVQEDVARLEGLTTDTLTSHGVTIIAGRARISSPGAVDVGGLILRARRILVATGARAERSGTPGDELCITSDEAFHLETIPPRMAMIGGGYISNEFAGIFRQFGAKVTIVCRSPQLIMAYDAALRDRLLSISLGKGIAVELNANLQRFERMPCGGIGVILAGRDPIIVDQVLLAVGRTPNVAGLGLEEIGVATGPSGAIAIDAEWRTSVPGVFAIGDVTGRIQLTPVAIREGQAFAEREFGGMETRVDYSNIPSAVFSNPPVAGVGLTEEQARRKFGDVQVHSADFTPLRNKLAGRRERALYKIVCQRDTGRVLGVHMIGPDAPEILQAAAVAVVAGLTKAQLDDTLGIFPTMAEELVEMA